MRWLPARVFHPFSIYLTTLASLIVLLPGPTLTVAMRELATRNLVSGTARLTGAVLVFFQLGFGVALGSQINRILPPVTFASASAPLPDWTLGAALLIAPLAFTVLFNASRRDLGWIMLACWLSFSGARAGAFLLGPELGVCNGERHRAAAQNAVADPTNKTIEGVSGPALPKPQAGQGLIIFMCKIKES